MAGPLFYVIYPIVVVVVCFVLFSKICGKQEQNMFYSIKNYCTAQLCAESFFLHLVSGHNHSVDFQSRVNSYKFFSRLLENAEQPTLCTHNSTHGSTQKVEVEKEAEDL